MNFITVAAIKQKIMNFNVVIIVILFVSSVVDRIIASRSWFLFLRGSVDLIFLLVSIVRNVTAGACDCRVRFDGCGRADATRSC